MYGTLCMENRGVAECDYSNYCELCYEVSDCIRCYNTNYATDCKSVRTATIFRTASDLECILCTNLINQSHCIENKKLQRKYFAAKKNKGPQKAYENYKIMTENRKIRTSINCENCRNYLNCKNCENFFDMSNARI